MTHFSYSSMVVLNFLKENTDCPKVLTTGIPRTYSTASLDIASKALPYCRIFSAIRLPVMVAMMRKANTTGARLSRPSRQSNTSKRTNRPMGVAIALYLSGS